MTARAEILVIALVMMLVAVCVRWRSVVCVSPRLVLASRRNGCGDAVAVHLKIHYVSSSFVIVCLS